VPPYTCRPSPSSSSRRRTPAAARHTGGSPRVSDTPAAHYSPMMLLTSRQVPAGVAATATLTRFRKTNTRLANPLAGISVCASRRCSGSVAAGNLAHLCTMHQRDTKPTNWGYTRPGSALWGRLACCLVGHGIQFQRHELGALSSPISSLRPSRAYSKGSKTL
jgi:hypothetical protein